MNIITDSQDGKIRMETEVKPKVKFGDENRWVVVVFCVLLFLDVVLSLVYMSLGFFMAYSLFLFGYYVVLQNYGRFIEFGETQIVVSNPLNFLHRPTGLSYEAIKKVKVGCFQRGKCVVEFFLKNGSQIKIVVATSYYEFGEKVEVLHSILGPKLKLTTKPWSKPSDS